jgi:small redox-active disulfide protein 2
MKTLQILGTGCPKCNQLAAATEAAATALGLDYQLEKVSDLKRIMDYGVMATPTLVIDGTVKCVGRVPRVDEIKKLLSE